MGLKSILGIKNRSKALEMMDKYCVAPKIQPCVRLIKVIVRFREALGNVPGQT